MAASSMVSPAMSDGVVSATASASNIGSPSAAGAAGPNQTEAPAMAVALSKAATTRARRIERGTNFMSEPSRTKRN
jgi:hypothetical protein